MKKIINSILIAMLAAFNATAQTTNYVETFDPTVPNTVTNFSISLGGSYSMGINSNVTTIVDDFGVWGFSSNASFVAIGGANGNVLRPQLNGANNARVAGVFINPTNFNGLAGSYALSFDIIGADPGAGRVYIGQGSGYDLSGTSSNAIDLDLAQGGFGAYVGLTAVGDATVETLVNEELDEQTSTNLTFTFQYDGTSAVAIGFGGYNTSMQIDNVIISSTNVAPPLAGAGDVVMFGGDAAIFEGDVTINNLFVGQTDAGEIVQWNGVNSAGGSFGASGTLNGEGIGGALTNSANGLILTTVDIVQPGSNTFATGSPNVLGITGGGDNGKFNAGASEAWSFEFNKRVELKQLVLTALDFNGETIKVTIDGVATNSFTRLDANMADVSWEASANKYVYTYSSPIAVPKGTDITIEAATGNWGLQAIVVNVPQLTSAEFYDEWLAVYAGGMGSETNLLDNPDNDALNNLYEYAQGGDPTNSADVGNAPQLATTAAGGTNFIEYVYFKRTDAVDRGLAYYLELTDSLTFANWTNTGYQVTGEGAYISGFDAVTNRVPAVKASEFIRLQIELN